MTVFTSQSVRDALGRAGLLVEVRGSLPENLTGITDDSRQVSAGSLFVAVRGTARDGHDFLPALADRAGAAIVEDASRTTLPAFVVSDARRAAPIAAAIAYGMPASRLRLVGVTGTNGKTTTVGMLRHLLDDGGAGRSASIGTLGVLIGSEGIAQPGGAGLTTPGPIELQRVLRSLVDAGVTIVAMEVSSHSLDQRRVDGLTFAVAAFTNLTRDHLDYHGTMAAYGEAKARLLQWPGLRTAVINIGDPFGRELVRRARAGRRRFLTYGADGADIVATRVEVKPRGMTIDVTTPLGRGELEAPVAGAFNVQNLLGVLGVLLASDIVLDRALRALAHVTPPAGRMERFGGGADPVVIVDYAHSPDALEQVLAALRPALADGGRLIGVFGCGGDRDRGKRAQMGAVAGRLADRVIVTSDNPRSEDPRGIAHDIVEGLQSQAAHWVIELDRGRAIELALAQARANDIIVLAGKGHENYQEANGKRIPFSDARHVADALARRRGA